MAVIKPSVWAQQEYLVKKLYVFLDRNVKTHELRVVKKIVRGDWMSEVKIMGMVTKATKFWIPSIIIRRGMLISNPRKQGKEFFVEFLGWYPGKDYIGLVMEYCRYGDVSRCFPGPLSEEKAWTLCSQLLEGLEILHGMGITHRDIKPQVNFPVSHFILWLICGAPEYPRCREGPPAGKDCRFWHQQEDIYESDRSQDKSRD